MFDYLDRVLLKNLLRILSNFFLLLSKLISDYDKETKPKPNPKKEKKYPWIDRLWPLEKKKEKHNE